MAGKRARFWLGVVTARQGLVEIGLGAALWFICIIGTVMAEAAAPVLTFAIEHLVPAGSQRAPTDLLLGVRILLSRVGAPAKGANRPSANRLSEAVEVQFLMRVFPGHRGVLGFQTTKLVVIEQPPLQGTFVRHAAHDAAIFEEVGALVWVAFCINSCIRMEKISPLVYIVDSGCLGRG